MEIQIAVDTWNPLLLLPLYAAARRGMFARERLSVHFAEFPDAGSATESLLKGAARVACSGFDQVLRANARGGKLTAFGLLCRSPLLVMVTNPRNRQAPRSAANLESKRVAITATGSPSDIFARYVAYEAAVDPDSLHMVAQQDMRGVAAALESSLADAAVLDSTTAQVLATRLGTVDVLADTRTLSALLSTYGVSNYPGSCVYAESGWLEQHRDEARRLLRALLAGTRWCQRQAPSECMKVLPEAYRRSQNAAAVTAAIAEAIPLLSQSAAFTLDGADAVRKVLAVSAASFRETRTEIREFENGFLPQPNSP